MASAEGRDVAADETSVPGYLIPPPPMERASPMGASGYGPPGFSEQQASDVDVTVMAYAQWLSEMKQQATNARYQQQAELDLMRDAINANNGELVDFKRHSSQVVQQLQGQVTELRARLSDAFAEMAQQSRQRTEVEQRTGNAIGGLQQALNTRQMDLDSNRRSLAEQLERLSTEVESKLQLLEGEVGNIKRALGSGQEQTIMKFSEVDKAMSIFHQNINGARQELTDTREDWKKSQDLLGQAISTLSQDLADFQKHASTVMNKLQSDAYHFEELGRDSKERMRSIEAQLTGIQQSVYSTNNELILLRGKAEEAPVLMRTPQRQRPSPRVEAQGSVDGSVSRFIERNESAALLEGGSAAAAAVAGAVAAPPADFPRVVPPAAFSPAGAAVAGSAGTSPLPVGSAPGSQASSVGLRPQASRSQLTPPQTALPQAVAGFVGGGGGSIQMPRMMSRLPAATAVPSIPTPPAGASVLARSPTPTVVRAAN